MSTPDLVAELVAARGDTAIAPAPELAADLAAALATARAAHPDLAVDPVGWVRALARHAPDPLPASAPFAHLAVADLYLAYACGEGNAAALAACSALLEREATHAAHAARLDASVRDEAIQIVRTLAFVPRAERPPAIHDYSGRGALGGWLRVLVARELIRLAKQQQRSAPLADDILELAAIDDDPLVEQLKTQYRAELAQAFRVALAALPKGDRLLLRYQVVDGLSIDEIGTLTRVHRATAARRLAAIRDALVERTRAELGAALGVNTVEAASIVRMVQSRLEVSVIRHLQGGRRDQSSR